MKFTLVSTNSLEDVAGLFLAHIGKGAEKIDSRSHFDSMGHPTPEKERFVSICGVDCQYKIVSWPSGHSSSQQTGNYNVDNLLVFRDMRNVEYLSRTLSLRDIYIVRIILSDCI